MEIPYMTIAGLHMGEPRTATRHGLRRIMPGPSDNRIQAKETATRSPKPAKAAFAAEQEMPTMNTSVSARRFSRTNTANDHSPEFYTVAQLARRLQFTKMTIHRMVSRGELPCYLFGRVKRFHHEDVEAFLRRCRTQEAFQSPAMAASPVGW
jgi:excisionase family DNA binding protein